MKHARLLRLLVLALVMSLGMTLMPAAPATAVEPTRTVSGTVYLDGIPMPGVEVFLSASPSQYTCTDASGNYSFSDVPDGAVAFAATGSSVVPGNCPNEKAVTVLGHPLLPGFYPGNTFVVDSDMTDVDMELRPLPYDSPLLNLLARKALHFHYDIQIPWLRNLYVAAYDRVYDAQVARGILRGEVLDLYGEYLDHMRFLFGLATM